MTISSTTRKVQFTGTGAVFTYAFTFKAFDEGDLLVVLLDTVTGLETTQVITTNYSVSLNDDQNNNPGGTITMAVAPASDETLTITTDIDYLQPMDLTNQGGFYPSVITDSADRQVIQIQQLQEKSTRSLVLPLSVDTSVDSELPQPEAESLLRWNSAGTAIENYASSLGAGAAWDSVTGKPFVTTAISIAASTTASALGYSEIQILSGGSFAIESGQVLTIDVPFRSRPVLCFTGLGSVVFSSGSVPVVFPEWFGAAGDDSNDDTAALQLAISSLTSGGVVFLQEKTYQYSTLAVAVEGVAIVGASRLATLKQKASLPAGTHGIVVTSVDNFMARSITLDGNGANQTEALRQLRLLYGDDHVISDVRITNALGWGLDIQQCDNTRVLNSGFDNCEHGMVSTGSVPNYTTNLKVSGCQFDGNITRGVLTDSTKNAVFVNCSATGNIADDGFAAKANTRWVRYTNCVSESNGRDGFDCSGGSSTAEDITYVNCSANDNTEVGFNPSADVSRCQIIGCYAEGNAYGVATTTDAADINVIGGVFRSNTTRGIQIYDTIRFVLLGNVCSENTLEGIYVTGSGGNNSRFGRISSNTCVNNGGDGIGLKGDTLVVTDNVCYDDQGPKTQPYGINVYTTGDTVLENNYCVGNLTGDITSSSNSARIENGMGYDQYVTLVGHTAISTSAMTRISSAAGAIPGLTLADGQFINQDKWVVMTTAGNSATLTVASHISGAGTTFVFNAVGDYLHLRWVGNNWMTIASAGI